METDQVGSQANGVKASEFVVRDVENQQFGEVAQQHQAPKAPPRQRQRHVPQPSVRRRLLQPAEAFFEPRDTLLRRRKLQQPTREKNGTNETDNIHTRSAPVGGEIQPAAEEAQRRGENF